MIYSAAAFNAETGISFDLAKRILDLLEEKDLEPTEMNTVMWRLRDYVCKTHVPEIMEEMEDEEITSIIDQMIIEQAMWKSQCPSNVCCAETEEELRSAFAEWDAEKLCEILVEGNIFIARGGNKQVSAATKKKISDALKAFYKGKGGKTVKTRSGTATTIDTGSPEEFLKTIKEIPAVVVDAVKNLPENVKSLPSRVKAAVKKSLEPKRGSSGGPRGRGKRIKTMQKNKTTDKYAFPESAWFFSAITEKKEGGYKEGDIVTIQIFRTGSWEHPGYGKVEISKQVIKDVVENFKDRKRGIELCVDENHEPDHKALGWFKDVYDEDDGEACFAKIEITKRGADLLNDGAYKYFSPEIVFNKVDEESGEEQNNLLIGGAFTNRPFFKGMQPLMASEDAANGEQSGVAHTKQGQALFISHSSMKKFLELMSVLVEKSKITASEKSELDQVFNDMPEEDRSDAVKAAYTEICGKFDEEGGEGEGETPEQKAAREQAEADAAASGEGEGDGTGEGGAAEVPANVDGVQANEDGTFTITDPVKFSESLKGIQSLASKMQRETTLAACEKTIAPFVFSEKRKDRVVRPNQKQKIVAFAASLDEKKRAAFFAILGDLKAIPASEIGHGKTMDIDVTKPETFTAADEKVKWFMDVMKQDLATAQQSAATFYAEQAKRK